MAVAWLHALVSQRIADLSGELLLLRNAWALRREQ
jgi:hypothetical protein